MDCSKCGAPLPVRSGTGRPRKMCDDCSPYHAKYRAYYHARKASGVPGGRFALCAGGCGALVQVGEKTRPAGESTCQACRSAARAARAMDPCQGCGEPVKYRGAKYCSVQCASRHNGSAERAAKLRPPRLDKASRRAADRIRCAKRRARQEAVVVEVVEPLRVFERDGWRCHVRRGRIDRRLSGRHRMGPTIDHLVPISQGGEHSYANVAAAHRACNSSRGIGGTVQLALVG